MKFIKHETTKFLAWHNKIVKVHVCIILNILVCRNIHGYTKPLREGCDRSRGQHLSDPTFLKNELAEAIFYSLNINFDISLNGENYLDHHAWKPPFIIITIHPSWIWFILMNSPNFLFYANGYITNLIISRKLIPYRIYLLHVYMTIAISTQYSYFLSIIMTCHLNTLNFSTLSLYYYQE